MTGEALIKRSDDNAEALKKRLESYNRQTKPLVDYYTKRGIHTYIDADRPPKPVFESICKIFNSKQSKDKVIFMTAKN